MASYSIVLAPIAALMAFDFFIIKHARINIYELYRPEGIYRFTGGWNWRAFVALLIAVIPNLPGMINAIDATVRPYRPTPFCAHLPAIPTLRRPALGKRCRADGQDQNWKHPIRLHAVQRDGRRHCPFGLFRAQQVLPRTRCAGAGGGA
jgi:hypothetical protein